MRRLKPRLIAMMIFVPTMLALSGCRPRGKVEESNRSMSENQKAIIAKHKRDQEAN